MYHSLDITGMEDGDFGGMDSSLDMTMKIEFDYHQPVFIELPAEAKAAEQGDFKYP